MRGVEGVLEPISSLETLKKSGLLAISATIERGHFSQEHVARERLSATGFVLITAAVANDLVYGSAELRKGKPSQKINLCGFAGHVPYVSLD